MILFLKFRRISGSKPAVGSSKIIILGLNKKPKQHHFRVVPESVAFLSKIFSVRKLLKFSIHSVVRDFSVSLIIWMVWRWWSYSQDIDQSEACKTTIFRSIRCYLAHLSYADQNITHLSLLHSIRSIPHLIRAAFFRNHWDQWVQQACPRLKRIFTWLSAVNLLNFLLNFISIITLSKITNPSTAMILRLHDLRLLHTWSLSSPASSTTLVEKTWEYVRTVQTSQKCLI